MKAFNKFFLFLTVTFLAACASTAKSDIDPNIDFSQYKSFVWEYSSDNKERKIVDPVFDSPLFEKKLEFSVANYLLNAGFESSETPDLIFSYHLTDDIKRYSPVRVGLGYGRYSRNAYWNIFMPQLHRLEREEVLIVLDAVDANSNELVWRGWTKTSKRSTPLPQESIDRMVNKILSAWPQ